MKIEIILDKTKLLQKKSIEKNIDIYPSERDYFDAYVSLQTAVKRNSDKSIIVYSEPLKTWLSRGIMKYKKANVVEKEITYRDLLATKWQITFDIEVFDDEIERDNLLSLPLEGIQAQSLSSFVCSQLISSELDTPRFNRLKFGVLLTDLIRYQSRKNEFPRILNTVYHHKINKWLENSPQYMELIRYLTDGLTDLYEKSCLYKLIAKYPASLQKKCLGKEWVERFYRAKLNLEGLNVDSFRACALYSTVLISELNLFYEKIKRENTRLTKELLEQLLTYFSGELSEEIEYTLDILKSEPSLIDQKLVSKMKVIFKSLPPFYERKIDDLKSYVPPTKPPPFDMQGDLDNVVSWAVHKYLPYKFWLETTKKKDSDVLQCGAKFSQYIFDSYNKISYHHRNSVYRFLFNYKEQIAETSIPILLLLDNFNYKFFDFLQSSFAKYKIVLGKGEPYLSLLPTDTSVAKIAIISGKRDKVDNKDYDYAKNLTRKWQEYFPDHKIKYLSKAGELNEYKVADNEFIVINYLEIDDELHKSYQKTAIEHKKRISFIIENITELVANFIKRNNIENKTKIFFISDHGSTLITKSIENKIDVDYFRRKSIDLNHRFIIADDETFQSMKSNDNISDALFFLNKETCGDGKNYIIARGYGRFKDINGDFYVHGGVLPEEIIVPAGYFEYGIKDYRDIILQLPKREYRLMTRETIVLRLANPNSVAAQNILIGVKSNGLSLLDMRIEVLPGNADIEVSKEIRIPNRVMKSFHICIDYEIANRSFRETLQFPIKIKTFAQSDFDFEKL